MPQPRGACRSPVFLILLHPLHPSPPLCPLSAGQSVPEVDWILPGQDAALSALSLFLTSSRIRRYDSDRNDPSKGPLCLSGTGGVEALISTDLHLTFNRLRNDLQLTSGRFCFE